LISNDGPQQDDPIGPLLFSNTIQPLLESLESELPLGYLDDLTLGGPQSVVAADVRCVTEVGQATGLVLNVNKCELISHPSTVVSDPALQSFQRVSVSDTVLLGAPVLQGQSLDKHWSNRCNDLSRAVDRLTKVASRDALILLQASFSTPRVQHLLQCSPSADHAALATFDDTLRSAVCTFTNFELTDTQWLQATLPIRDGGLGVRRVSSMALSAFVASAVSTLSLQETIL